MPRTAALLCSALALLVGAAAAAEDAITVKGDTLRGAVTGLSASGVVFEPVYGAGAITVPWSDVEDIQTADAVTVLYGDRGEVRGRLLGLVDGALLVGPDAAGPQAIETGRLFGMTDDEGSLRSRFRHWTASFDAGGAFTDATTDRVSGSLGTRVEYQNEPFHWLLEGTARFAEEKSDAERVVDDNGTPGDPSDDIVAETRNRDVTENIQSLFSRGEYDISDRIFGFAALRLTRDTVQELSLRTEPKAGFGVRVFEHDRFKLSTDIGGAFVDEDFFGGRRSSFWAVAFGTNAEAALPYGATWRARVEYVPSVVEWVDDYLIRGSTELALPLLGWLSFVVALEDLYDNTPAEDTERNRVTTTGSLRARFP